MRWVWSTGVLLALAITTAAAQQDLPTELDDCTGPGADFCFDRTLAVAVIDSGCGARFEGYVGRISWPVMRNVGPVTIAVQTRYLREGNTQFPLYVEVDGRTSANDSLHCRTGLAGQVVLVAQGADQCGGTWESVGPLDLRHYGVRLGKPYTVQCIFFRPPLGSGLFPARSIGFSCIRVTTAPTAVTTVNWGIVKSLYRDPSDSSAP